MATVPVPRTWVTGEFVVASYMNGIRDALNFLLQQPLCVARQTVGQGISSSWVGVTMDAEDIDRDGGHSTVTNTSRYTAQTPGWYRVDGTIVWTSSVNGPRAIAIWVNATNEFGYATIPPGSTDTMGLSTTATVFLNGTTDFAEVRGFSFAGATTTSTSNGGSRMAAAYASIT